MSAAPAVGVVVWASRPRLVALSGLTVSARPVPCELEPSVTVSWGEPALSRVIAPFLPAETVATPELNPIAVELPRLTAAPEESVTVAWAPRAEERRVGKEWRWAPV